MLWPFLLTFAGLQDGRQWLVDARHGHHDAEDLNATAAHVHHEAHHADVLRGR